jgi:SSS family solute:Na+ symporter
MHQRSFILAIISLTLGGAGRAHAGTPDPAPTDELRSRCYDVLVGALADESPWVRVHAAEALVSLDRPAPALAEFRPKAESAAPPYRVVVWRVLAAAEPEAPRRRQYVERIRAALLDPNGPDRTHAMEALAKLHEPPADGAERRHVRDVADGAGPASPFAIWRLAQAGDSTAVDRLVRLLQANDVTTRTRAAYVLGRMHPLPATATAALSAALGNEPADSPARTMLRAAAGGDAVRELARDPRVPPSGRYFAATWLADFGTAREDATLVPLLHDPDRDVQVGAALALLQIDRRAAAAAAAPPARSGRD